MADEISAWKVLQAALAASTDDHVGVVYDICQSGEAVTHPHIRVPSLRAESVKLLVRGVFTG
eukprot:2905938-Amphidinium_carterae.1